MLHEKENLPGKIFTFVIEQPDEPMAGITGFTETIIIQVDSGDPGSPEGFREHMRQALSEWYYRAKVK